MIPAELRAMKGWLVWRYEPNRKQPSGKPLKVPYYVDGGRRQGVQGSPEDRAGWATWEAAQAFVDDDLIGEWGLGFALSAEWGVVGLDFDACVDERGVVNAEVEAVVSGTYAEYSPSGRGIHAFLVGQLPNKKSGVDRWPWGFETFCTGGYLTMTGRATPVCEIMGWDTLDHVNGVVTELCKARFGPGGIRVREPGEASVVPSLGLTETEIRKQLWRVTADGTYSEWFKRGCAVHHETGGSPAGEAIWDEHSAQGRDYAGHELVAAKWASMGRRAPGAEVVTFAHILRLAGPDPDVFDDISELDERPPMPAGGSGGVGGGSGAADVVDVLTGATAQSVTVVGSAVLTTRVTAALPPVKRRGIPEAHHLTTDQANANRLVNAFGRQVFVAAGRWYVWDGRRWVSDEADVYRYGCRLSDLIRVEAAEVKARASVNPDPAAIKKAAEIAAALMKWAVKSEMKGTIEAAIGLARKMLTIDSGLLDRDPWALNCLNGVVDLRTGELKRHNPDDYITKLVSVAYAGDAQAPAWVAALDAITCGDAGLMRFLQRWFGYCLTGLVTEQAFVVHWGTGSNGKSTVLDTMAEVLGDYAGAAAPGLLAAGKGGAGDRHPTEIAALMGRRMVTAHESGEGVVLREDFVKQATGGDKLTARFMREDFFDFAPTHKIQLLTNHKPAIKGQDRGIWRRVLLVPYLAAFGDADQVGAGTHTHLQDREMVARLRTELPGVLTWCVRGCLAWAAGGLTPPPVVLQASADYKAEQDRVGQFVEECCESGGTFEEPLTAGMAGGLYVTYSGWAKEGGIYPLSKMKFTEELLRVVAGAEIYTKKMPGEDGRRKDVRMVRGVRLLPD